MKKRSRAVVVLGYVGLEGTAILAKSYKNQIDSHYPLYLSRNAVQLAEYSVSNARIIREIAEKYLKRNKSAGSDCGLEEVVVNIDRGGFLAAMWELAKVAGEGFTVDLRKVPMKQETVEICELLEVNPYKLLSKGTIIAIVDDGLLLKEELEKAGMECVIIGYTNSSKAHILMNDGTESHLNRPEPDELERLGICP